MKNSHELFKENKSLQRNFFHDEVLANAPESRIYSPLTKKSLGQCYP